ncbi:MAG: hypothetical protein JRN06_06205 [Nitrososphaerota archaeon]|nr:hypothetical protein [Nitrososphaerota archaeon]
MKTKTAATAAIVALLLSVVATAALASTGTSGSSLSSNVRGPDNNDHPGLGDHHGPHGPRGPPPVCNNLTVGETLTVSGLTGHYANATDRRMNGNASGTFTFKVSGVFTQGCTLSITGGSFKLNTTSYTATGGSIVLNHGGRSGVGSGTTSSGSFLINVAGLQGNSTSANVGNIRLDFETGTSQFLVNLHSMQVHPPIPGDTDNDGN